MDGNSTAIALLMLGMYFLPTIAAYRRRHHNREAIFLLNALLGWTVLGWIATAVWALTARMPASAPAR